MDKRIEKVVPAGEFKQKCLALMDQVRATGEEIVITKRGKPVCRLVPACERKWDIFGWMKGTCVIHGDLTEPTGEKWEAEN